MTADLLFWPFWSSLPWRGVSPTSQPRPATVFPVTPLTRNGFGCRVIERGLPHELEGTVNLEYPVDRVNCTINVPATGGLFRPSYPRRRGRNDGPYAD